MTDVELIISKLTHIEQVAGMIVIVVSIMIAVVLGKFIANLVK